MEPGRISVTRVLPMDSPLLADALRRLRRDATGGVLRWGLGDRGTVEVDATFTSHGPAWTTGARLWDTRGRALALVSLELVADGTDVALTLRAPAPELCDLAQAVVDELAEELLWHATRESVAG
jgi:hypothetical protein